CGTLNTYRRLNAPVTALAVAGASQPVAASRAPQTLRTVTRPAAAVTPKSTSPRARLSGRAGKTLQKVLVGLVILGGLGSVLHQGTLATFNATTTQGSNTFQTGTVTMTNVAGTVIAGANCPVSTNNGSCATLFGAANTGALKPSAVDISNNVTITYTGSLSPTTDFRLYASNYTAKTGASSALCTAPAAGAGNPGTAVDLLFTVGAGSPALLYPVQNTVTTAAIGNGATVTTVTVSATTAVLANGANVILYTAASGTYQQFTTSAAVGLGATSIPVVSQTAAQAFGIGTQVAPQGTLDDFATTYTTSGNGLRPKGGVNGAGAAGAWATNDNSIFNIKVHLDAAAGNTLQGCQSQSDLVWYAQP
ncbi:MAG TPA: hypothetical protein VIC62_23005, partial [Nakamurella sp.]